MENLISLFVILILSAIYFGGMLIAFETSIGKKLFRFLMSFFVSSEKFESIDWNKPVANWMSALTWMIYLGLFIYFIFI